jgi:hypothetical protein
MAGADLLWEKSTGGWLLVAGLFWDKTTADWWLISHEQGGCTRKTIIFVYLGYLQVVLLSAYKYCI